MDTVVSLAKPEDISDDTAIRLEFRKARLRTPVNANQFAPLIIRPGDEWQVEAAARTATSKEKRNSTTLHGEYIKAYDRLADAVEETPGFDGKPVRKVSIDAVRDELKRRGFLDTNDKGGITPTSRSHLLRARVDLLKAQKLVASEGFIWRP